MPYIIILKIRKFHQPTANRFSAAMQKPVGGGGSVSPSLHRVKHLCLVFVDIQHLPLDTKLIVIFELITAEHETADTLTAPSWYILNICHRRFPFSTCL